MVSVKEMPPHGAAEANPVLRATTSFLYGLPIECNPGGRQTTTAYLIPVALRAVAATDREIFKRVYTEIRRRKVQPDADWVFDNFLLFALTVGVVKFQEDRAFLAEVCRQRIAVQQGDELEMAQGFEALLRDETLSVSLDLSLVVKGAVGVHEFDTSMVKGAYTQARKRLTTGSTDPFQLLICQRAVDLAFEHSPLALVSVPTLTGRFRRRAAIVAAVLYWLIFLGCLAGFACLLWYFLFGSGKSEAFAEKLISLGLSSTPLVVFGAKKRIQATFCARLEKFWLGTWRSS